MRRSMLSFGLLLALPLMVSCGPSGKSTRPNITVIRKPGPAPVFMDLKGIVDEMTVTAIVTGKTWTKMVKRPGGGWYQVEAAPITRNGKKCALVKMYRMKKFIGQTIKCPDIPLEGGVK